MILDSAMPVLKIGQLLGASDELRAISARTRKMRELQTLYVDSAPTELAKASKVQNFRAGTLFIAAPNAAVAAKLRQTAPTILAEISKSVPEVTAIRIQVEVTGRARPARAKSQKIALPSDALGKLEALSRRVANEDLKSALARLVQHQRRTTRCR